MNDSKVVMKVSDSELKFLFRLAVAAGLSYFILSILM